MIETYFVKRAWVRLADIPPGQPAPGHITCPCGNAPLTRFDPSQGNVICNCGAVYTWDGWIIAEQEFRSTPAKKEQA